ncbi:hypothetical protein ACTHGU_14045 [Chitinophagaceae bacterium MMS25-I14]
MPGNFTETIHYDGRKVSAVFLPSQRSDGMYYEINIQGFPRFYMTWSPADRYDIVPDEGIRVPYNLILALSDAIEKKAR